MILVLSSGVSREELGRKIVVRYGWGIVRREVVVVEAEWADPEPSEEIDDGERVEDGATGVASEWKKKGTNAKVKNRKEKKGNRRICIHLFNV